MKIEEPAAHKSERSLHALVKRLRSPSPRARWKAARLLRKAGPAAITPILNVLDQERKQRRFHLSIHCTLSVLMVAGYVWWMTHLHDPHFWPLGFVVLFLLSVDVSLRAATHTQIETTKILAGCSDIRAVGPLAEALEFRDLWRNSGTPGVAADALCRLLPQMEPEDASCLSERQRECLYHVLEVPNPQHLELRLAILRALPRISDPRSLPHIERLARLQPVTLPGKQVYATACECLILLRENLENRRAPQTLLRAAAPTTSPDLLLRPAESTTPNPTELLRPTSTGQD